MTVISLNFDPQKLPNLGKDLDKLLSPLSFEELVYLEGQVRNHLLSVNDKIASALDNGQSHRKLKVERSKFGQIVKRIGEIRAARSKEEFEQMPDARFNQFFVQAARALLPSAMFNRLASEARVLEGKNVEIRTREGQHLVEKILDQKRNQVSLDQANRLKRILPMVAVR